MTYDLIKKELEKFSEIEIKKNYKERKFFDEIWGSRDHSSQLSGYPLFPRGHFKWHWQFLHVLPKGSYPKFRFFKYNILLGTPEEHEKQDQFPVFRERKEMLRKIYYEVYYNKQF